MKIDAESFATMAHKGQKYGDEDFIVHPRKVVDILAKYKEYYTPYDYKVLVDAAWLHDVLEDTKFTWGDIQKQFGEGVCRLVYAVTNEYGENRKEKWENTCSKVLDHPLAVHLKLIDRIANVQSAVVNGKFRRMYLREHKDFVLSLMSTIVRVPHLWCLYFDTIERLREMEE